MKYTLINCYSDRNNGDLGIILSTIHLLKKADPNAEIACISTYNYSDPLFKSEHKLLQKVTSVIPAIFGELNLFSSKSTLSKSIRLAIDILRLGIYFLTPKSALPIIENIFFSRHERKALKNIGDADFVISKGGSFLCEEADLRSKIALLRFLFIFFVAIKKSKKIVILAQSLGPVYSSINRSLLNYVLRNSHSIVLREHMCLAKYRYIHIPASTTVINDIAFFMDGSQGTRFEFALDKHNLNIGVTVKFVEQENSKEYQTMLKVAIEHLIQKYKAVIHIFPHVTIENDIQNSYNILSLINDSLKSNIRIYSGNYDARTLRASYSKMDFFIGTRLHSTIFAMSELVPSVCITYHGTKALGVFKNFGLEDYVITDYSGPILIETMEKMIQNREEIIGKINNTLVRDQAKFVSFLAALQKKGNE